MVKRAYLQCKTAQGCREVEQMTSVEKWTPHSLDHPEVWRHSILNTAHLSD